jgi:hypothetical protein
MLFAVVVPFGGPSVTDELAALIVLPAPVAQRPRWLADVAVVVEVLSVLLLRSMPLHVP